MATTTATTEGNIPVDTPLVKRAYNLGLKAVPNFTQLTEQQIAFYEEHLDEIPAALSRGFALLVAEAAPAPTVTPVKFGLLEDLGIIEVPADYVPVQPFAGMNFPCPTRVLKPGDWLWVRAHKQIIGGTTTSEERLAYLATLGSHLVGPQGVEIVEAKRRQLPKGYWYTSFDEKERLPLDAERRLRVPAVYRDFGFDFDRDLGFFEDPWGDFYAILSFCVPSVA